MWQRRIILQLTKKSSDANEEAEIIKTFCDHRIDFVYYSLMGGLAADTCEIKLYNLSNDQLKFFADGTRKPTDNLRVILKAGYLDEWENEDALPIVLDGEVMNVFGTRELPNHITTLYCVPLEGRAYNSNPTRLVVPEGKTLREVFKGLAESSGLEVSFSTDPRFDAVLDAKLHKFETDGTIVEIMNRLTKQHHLHYNFVRGRLTIANLSTEEELRELAAKKEKEFEDGTGFSIDVTGVGPSMFQLNTNLLRRTPDIQLCRFSAAVALNTTMRPLDRVDVSKITKSIEGEFPLIGVGSNNTGASIYRDRDAARYTVFSQYQIQSLVHVGSNYSETWETSFESAVFRDNNADNAGLPINEIVIT